MLNLFLTILRRDLTLSLRRKSDLAQVIFFFAVVVTLVPLGVGAETNILRAIAPGVVWVAALLAALLSLPRMFATDHEDGTLEQMLVAAEPLPVIVIAKVAAHWLVTGVPMTIFATIFGAGAAQAVSMSLSPSSHFMIVGGLALFSLALAPMAVAAALRIAEQ